MKFLKKLTKLISYIISLILIILMTTFLPCVIETNKEGDFNRNGWETHLTFYKFNIEILQIFIVFLILIFIKFIDIIKRKALNTFAIFLFFGFIITVSILFMIAVGNRNDLRLAYGFFLIFAVEIVQFGIFIYQDIFRIFLQDVLLLH